MPGPISQNGIFYSNDVSSLKLSWFHISFKSDKPFGHKERLRILQLPIPYCVSLIMVTITSHIFINIFQTVHFPAVKFLIMRKIGAFFWYQNLRKFEKNLKWSDRAPLTLCKTKTAVFVCTCINFLHRSTFQYVLPWLPDKHSKYYLIWNLQKVYRSHLSNRLCSIVYLNVLKSYVICM